MERRSGQSWYLSLADSSSELFRYIRALNISDPDQPTWILVRNEIRYL